MLNKVKLSRLKLPLDKFKVARFITDKEADVLFSNARGFSLAFESGTAHGFSGCILSAAGAEVYTFDIVCRPKIWEHIDMSPLPDKINIHIQPFNVGVIAQLEKFAISRKNAIFFIDGDHKRESVINDWNAIKTFLIPGDCVIFHDLNEKGPRKFWGRLTSKNSKGFEFEVIETERRIGKLTITKEYNHATVEV